MGVMTSWSVRKGGKTESRQQQRGIRQHPVVTERIGGFGSDRPCVNGITYRQIGAKPSRVREEIRGVGSVLHSISLVW